jgi:hypothetical protein
MTKMLIKRPTPPAPTPPAGVSSAFTDSYGITYLNGQATVRASVDVKLSRNYQSVGLQASLEFTTPSASVDSALPAVFNKLRDRLNTEIPAAISQLTSLSE